MKNYTSVENIENYLLIEIDEGFEPQVKRWIESTEEYIDKETGRNFVADKEFSVRKYDGTGDSELLIDDCVEIKNVKIDGEEKEVLSYPANDLPKTKIALDGDKFTKGKQNIEVTAKWGYSEKVPADIEAAATILVAGIINRSLSHEGEVQSVNMGRYSVTYKTERQWNDYDNVQNTLKKYQKYHV